MRNRLGLAALAIAIELVSERAHAADDPPVIGQPRPELDLRSVDGSPLTEGLVEGQPFIVEFFATWCQPCHKALADMTDARRAAGARFQVILVDVGESAGVVERWKITANLPPDTIVALDPSSQASRRWGVSRFPTTFVVDAGGVVRHINRGWGPGYRDRLLRWLRKTAIAAGSGASR